MVNLSRIYTRTGDAGNTRLSDFSETAKTDPRVQAYGHVDEANSILGVALTQPGLPTDIAAVLRHIQNELFDCGADLSNPLKADSDPEPLRVIQDYVDRLEAWCDHYSAELPELRSFILPGGSPAAAWLQFARSVVRRAERTAWAAASVYGIKEATDGRPGGVNLVAIAYLNRLSDLLFILGRAVDKGASEVLWVPGKDRDAPDPKAQRQRSLITTPDEPAAKLSDPLSPAIQTPDAQNTELQNPDSTEIVLSQDLTADQQHSPVADNPELAANESASEADSAETAAPVSTSEAKRVAGKKKRRR
jgi:cob(I)alamin adenosyltransferase